VGVGVECISEAGVGVERISEAGVGVECISEAGVGADEFAYFCTSLPWIMSMY